MPDNEREKEKSVLDILYEIRDRRNSEFAGATNKSVVLVQLLGQGDKTKKDIFRLVEEILDENGNKTTNILYYNYENGKPVLLETQLADGTEIVNGNKSVDEIQEIKDEIQRCIEERKRQMQAIAKKNRNF